MNTGMKVLIGGSIFILLAAFTFVAAYPGSGAPQNFALFPGHKAVNVNPDTHLQMTFPGRPVLGGSGQVRIYDAADDSLVDLLDLSIPSGPAAPTPSPEATYTPVPYEYVSGRFTNADTKAGTPSGEALPTSDAYQLNIIGGFSDAFHFHPVIVRGNTATIYPHNNLLEYGRTYYVQVDPGVLTLANGEFKGISGDSGWRFSTKRNPPPEGTARLVVSADGTGDFNTVQGALDHVPDFHSKGTTIFIRKGNYEEIVYFRNKANVTIVGEDRDAVVISYENNEVFNPHPLNIKTNEVPGTFPSRRAVFAADNSKSIHLVNLTVKNTSYGQAEGLLLNVKQFIACDVTIIGSGDALQSNGSAYFTGCRIAGDGDTILGRGPAFFNRCELNSYGPYMWIRNTSANHGNVFVNCLFRTRGEGNTVLARNPTNGGKNYPYSEAVLIDCVLSGISPAGWGEIGGDASNIRYWEYNSRNPDDGTPVDVSGRHPASRQLTMGKDADAIENYRNPAYVLGGWVPEMAPLILSHPGSMTVKAGSNAVFRAGAAAVPDPQFQWYKNGKPVKEANSSSLVIENAGASDAGAYTVKVENDAGTAESEKAVLIVAD